MNKIKDTEIKQKLKETYNKISKIYKIDRILGIFVTGLANYGFAETSADIKYTVVYLPTFEELCMETPFIFIDGNIRIVDIRKFYFTCDDKYDYDLELLYSRYAIINPMYDNLFQEKFIQKRDEIAFYCPEDRMKRVENRIIQAIEDKNNFEVMRLLFASKEYIITGNIEKCFYPTDEYIVDYLWLVKENKKNIDIENIYSEIEILKNQFNKNKNEISKLIVEDGIISLMANALRGKTDTEKFYNALTDNEKIALKLILSKLENGIGNISISQLLTESTLSRPVYKSLLIKMEMYKVAEIINKGAKGTYIKLYTNLN